MSLPFNQKYMTMDTETEGLSLYRSRPWQVSWQINEGTKLVSVFDEYVDWPDLKISADVQRITNFSWDTYHKKKKKPKEVLEKLENFLYNEDYLIVGQNLLGYDVYIVATLQRLCGKPVDYSYINRIYDTRALGKGVREGLQKPKDKDLLSWQYKMINDRTMKSKVSQLAQLKYFDIPHDPSSLHNAVVDIDMTFKIFTEIKKKMDL